MINISKLTIDEREIKEVIKVLRSGQVAQGKKVQEFEKKFANYVGTKYAIAVSSGTAALYTCLLANKIKKGDEVITTPFSFISTANSILFCGAKPVFVDISEEDFNIDPEKIQDKIGKKTKAILPVHLYGQPCDMKTIEEIVKDHKLKIIEDACQAHGAEFDYKRVGSFGCGCFSFYATKNMTTTEGGMVTTNDSEVAKKVGMLRDHGCVKKYYHEILGFNFRMTEIEAVIGVEQLNRLEMNNEKRIENAGYLTGKLKSLREIITPKVKRRVKHVFHQYTIRAKQRDMIQDYLFKNKIETKIFYPLPIHKQKLYQKLRYKESLPVSEKVSKEVLSLPVHPLLERNDLDYVVEKLEEIFNA